MMAPGMEAYQRALSIQSQARKPTRLPKDIFMTPAAQPPSSTAQAERILPALQSLWKSRQRFFWLS